MKEGGVGVLVVWQMKKEDNEEDVDAGIKTQKKGGSGCGG